MSINLSQLAPYIWILAAILAVVIAIVLLRFFWQHILKHLLQGCLFIVGIIILLALLRYLKII